MRGGRSVERCRIRRQVNAAGMLFEDGQNVVVCESKLRMSVVGFGFAVKLPHCRTHSFNSEKVGNVVGNFLERILHGNVLIFDLVRSHD